MIPFPSVLRGLAHRAPSSLMLFVVAVASVGAAAAGPTYYQASRVSILQDALSSAPAAGRGLGFLQAGPVAGSIEPLARQVSGDMNTDLGGPATERRIFQAPIEGVEASAEFSPLSEDIPLVWRTGFCAHLTISGACPNSQGQVLVSTSLAATNGWHTGEHVTFAAWGALVITGIYRPPSSIAGYWFDRASTYFPHEMAASQNINAPPAYDAMFTPLATVQAAPSAAQGYVLVDELLARGRVTPRDTKKLSAGVTTLVNDPVLNEENTTVTSDIPATLATVQAGWSSLETPVALITAQLLGLAWVLLFLLSAGTVEARSPDIALAKLRGHGRWRTAGFGLGEPLTILLVALPAGALAGWAATGALSGILLRPGTPVVLPALGWAAACAATAGGVAAVLLAARRALSRPVVEQWRRSGRRATRRGWVIDAVLLAGAAAGVAELVASGQISSAHQQVLSLLAPGLIGVAVAVVASRLLPVGCGAAARVSKQRGGLASYLALRHIARRAGGVRTTMLVATSFALATFAVAAWLVGNFNYNRVARARAGAPTVLTVSVPGGKSLPSVVDSADPGGKRAAVVETYESNSQTTLAVDPRRFVSVASWGPGLSPKELAALAAALHPPAPPPLVLNGDALRASVVVSSLGPFVGDLTADVLVPTGFGPTPLDMGRLPSRGAATLTASLSGCPCTLQDLQVNLPGPGLGNPKPEEGSITLRALEVHTGGGWVPVAGAMSSAGRWSSAGGSVSGAGGGITWDFSAPSGHNPTLVSVDRPARLPAIASTSLTGGRKEPYSAVGLSGESLAVNVIASVEAVPGAPAHGVIVDRAFADLAAGNETAGATRQVWIAAGARNTIEPRLLAAGIKVISQQQEASIAATLDRQGPGLASVLFLADAGAAALLAGAGAIAGLSAYGRRRRYEYAALIASGLSRRTLLRSLLAEQVLVLGFGTIAGVVAGLAAVAVALRSVPEFVSSPAAPSLSYVPPAATLAVILAAMVIVVLAAAAGAGGLVMREVRLEQLREAPA